MQACIYQPAKTAMQSGKICSKHWILKFEHDGSRFIEPIMGWTASEDMSQEIKLKFSTKEMAVAFAEKNHIEYEVIEPQRHNFIKRSYADNFK